MFFIYSSDVNSYEGCVEGTNIDRTSVKLWLHVAKYVDILANNEIGVNRVSVSTCPTLSRNGVTTMYTNQIHCTVRLRSTWQKFYKKTSYAT